MKISKNQSGIAHPMLILLILLTVAAVGAAFWRVSSVKPKTVTATITQPANKEEAKVELSEYKNTDLGFKLSYPKVWGDAKLADGKFVSPASGSYKQLTFSKQTAVNINFVIVGTASPLDGCGQIGTPAETAEYVLATVRGSVIGWDDMHVKTLSGRGAPGSAEALGQFGPEKVYPRDFIKTGEQYGYEKVSIAKNALVFKNKTTVWKATTPGADDVCDQTITQAQADQGNEYQKFVNYALNFSVGTIKGVNAEYDARKALDHSLNNQIVDTLNTTSKL